MTLLFTYETTDGFDFDKEKIAESVVKEALSQEGFSPDCEVSLTFTDDEGIRELNRDFRGLDRATDVLSFPMIDFNGTPAAAYEATEEDINPDTDEIMLGDIVLSMPRVAAQAEEYGHSPLREFAFLIAHSMLHLLGYDHMEEDERLVMEEKQKQILSALGITR